jgi:hypothetical protein
MHLDASQCVEKLVNLIQVTYIPVQGISQSKAYPCPRYITVQGTHIRCQCMSVKFICHAEDYPSVTKVNDLKLNF